jgi:hypothetical protein
MATGSTRAHTAWLQPRRTLCADGKILGTSRLCPAPGGEGTHDCTPSAAMKMSRTRSALQAHCAAIPDSESLSLSPGITRVAHSFAA